MSASGAMPRLVGMGATVMPRGTAVTRITSPARTTRLGLPGPSSWPGWARSFLLRARGVVATSDSSRSLPIRGRSGRSWHISANRSNRRLGGGRQAGSERPGAHPGDRSTPLTSRSSVRRCLRKCHWPGYPLPVVPQPLLQHLVVKILHRNLSPGHLSGSDASRLAQYHPDRFHAD